MNADTSPPALADADSPRVREYMAEALRLDLVGPGARYELAEERLPGWVRSSNSYLSGFLVPSDAPPEQRSEPTRTTRWMRPRPLRARRVVGLVRRRPVASVGCYG